VIAWRSPETSTVVAYAGLPRVWYEDGDRYGSYIIWDNRWRRSVSPDDVIERVRSWRGEGIGRVLLLTSEVLSPRMQRALDTRELFHSDSATVTGEQYYVYDVPAGPPLAQRRATDAG